MKCLFHWVGKDFLLMEINLFNGKFKLNISFYTITIIGIIVLLCVAIVNI